jgi:hypothetical protein
LKILTDYWDGEEGAIFDANSYIIPCTATAAISEGQAVKMAPALPTGSTSRTLSVTGVILLGDGWGLATRAASAINDVVPIMCYGVYKMRYSGAVATSSLQAGSIVMSSYASDCGTLCTSTVDAALGAGLGGLASLRTFNGSSYIIGMALQSAVAPRDEVLILVGKCI